MALPPRVKLVCFDLGRVFLHYDFAIASRALSEGHKGTNQVTPLDILRVLDPSSAPLHPPLPLSSHTARLPRTPTPDETTLPTNAAGAAESDSAASEAFETLQRSLSVHRAPYRHPTHPTGPSCRERGADESLVAAFERGAMSSEEFHERVCAATGLQVSLGEFKRRYADMFWVDEEMCRVAESVRRDLSLPTALLSNTSPIHIQHCYERYGEVMELFNRPFFSYELGLLKPDPLIYRAVEEGVRRDVGAQGGEIAFIDDKIENVIGAEAAQWQAINHHPRDPARTKRLLWEILGAGNPKKVPSAAPSI